MNPSALEALSCEESPLARAYVTRVREGLLHPDAAQMQVLQRLLALEDALEAQMRGGLRGFFGLSPAPHSEAERQGVYIYGEVGRGKSLLMDLFFTHATVKRKRRVHFHAFMLEVHQRLQQQRSRRGKDPLQQIAKAIAKEVQLLCFDEFQVGDIADAMILGRLFDVLFNQGVYVVATSNRTPNELYKDGLQRERFVPFIALLKERLAIVPLEGPVDYRLQHMQNLEAVYFTPLGAEAEAFIQDSWDELTREALQQAHTLEVNGRKVTLEAAYGDVAKSSFAHLCEQPLGSADYLEIAREFGTLVLNDIPQLGAEERNAAKRFVILVDALYEHRVKLVCSAAVVPEELYRLGDGSFEFARTISRLMEMQSETYWRQEHGDV